MSINILKKSKSYSHKQLFLLFQLLFRGEIVKGVQQFVSVQDFKLIKSSKGKISLEHSIPLFTKTFKKRFEDEFSNDFFDGFFCTFKDVPLLMSRESYIAKAFIRWRFTIGR